MLMSITQQRHTAGMDINKGRTCSAYQKNRSVVKELGTIYLRTSHTRFTYAYLRPLGKCYSEGHSKELGHSFYLSLFIVIICIFFRLSFFYYVFIL
jgi:hypothetical protein